MTNYSLLNGGKKTCFQTQKFGGDALKESKMCAKKGMSARN